ncbi:HNH endonuclease [Laceyella sacchari]|uniref:HNH endonuclease n=1 Tax=Laceyella sacchari TaxID=37482 RepID=UPI000A8324E9|nr:HNH endonuclease [Laceyella sacchari]TCW35318.1 HNH endonuclease [Laceyella sacchari]
MSAQFPEEIQIEMVQRYQNGESARKIAESLGLHVTSVTRVLKRRGVKIRRCAGENHHQWKGGRIDKGDGYIGIWKPEHPRADKQGYVFEHTLVMEQMLGRLPKEGEQIHHINGDKKDNRPENLYLCKGSKEHKIAHWSVEWLLKDLIDSGVIGFKDGKYCLTEEFQKVRKHFQAGNSVTVNVIYEIAKQMEVEQHGNVSEG